MKEKTATVTKAYNKDSQTVSERKTIVDELFKKTENDYVVLANLDYAHLKSAMTKVESSRIKDGIIKDVTLYANIDAMGYFIFKTEINNAPLWHLSTKKYNLNEIAKHTREYYDENLAFAAKKNEELKTEKKDNDVKKMLLNALDNAAEEATFDNLVNNKPTRLKDLPDKGKVLTEQFKLSQNDKYNTCTFFDAAQVEIIKKTYCNNNNLEMNDIISLLPREYKAYPINNAKYPSAYILSVRPLSASYTRTIECDLSHRMIYWFGNADTDKKLATYLEEFGLINSSDLYRYGDTALLNRLNLAIPSISTIHDWDTIIATRMKDQKKEHDEELRKSTILSTNKSEPVDNKVPLKMIVNPIISGTCPHCSAHFTVPGTENHKIYCYKCGAPIQY